MAADTAPGSLRLGRGELRDRDAERLRLLGDPFRRDRQHGGLLGEPVVPAPPVSRPGRGALLGADSDAVVIALRPRGVIAADVLVDHPRAVVDPDVRRHLGRRVAEPVVKRFLRLRALGRVQHDQPHRAAAGRVVGYRLPFPPERHQPGTSSSSGISDSSPGSVPGGSGSTPGLSANGFAGCRDGWFGHDRGPSCRGVPFTLAPLLGSAPTSSAPSESSGTSAFRLPTLAARAGRHDEHAHRAVRPRTTCTSCTGAAVIPAVAHGCCTAGTRLPAADPAVFGHRREDVGSRRVAFQCP